jgi:hypothetical protein
MSISIWEPSRDPQVWARSGSPSTSKERCTEYLIQSSYLPSRLFPSPDLTLVRFALSPRWKKDQLSVRKLARATHVPRAVVYRRFTKSLEFVGRLLRWVPHLLSDAQKVRRVELSLCLLQMLKVQEQRAWHHGIILDESWFHCSTNYDSIWLLSGPERTCATI